MKEEIQKHVRNLFAQGKIKGFLALKQEGTDVGPHLFTKVDELEELSLGDRENPAEARYPLDKILTHIASEHPNETFGVLVRGCDERALRLLFSVSMLDADHVIPSLVRPNWPRSISVGSPFRMHWLQASRSRGLRVARIRLALKWICWANSRSGLIPSTAVSSALAAGTFVRFVIATNVALRKRH